MSLLQGTVFVLLALPMRILHVSGMYGRKYVGDVLQRDYVEVSRLRQMERFRESVRREGSSRAAVDPFQVFFFGGFENAGQFPDFFQ